MHGALIQTNFSRAGCAGACKVGGSKKHFEGALLESDSPEARDGLGLALWWLNDISGSHEQRTQAYLGYKSNGNLPKAARLAAWLARRAGLFSRERQCDERMVRARLSPAR